MRQISWIYFTILLAFCVQILDPLPCAKAEEFHLPLPGIRVPLSPLFNPPLLKGLKIHPDNPLRFDFILDQGDLQQKQLKQQSTRLIKYFLASLTIPEKNLWVNLSPYEKDRIIPQSFGLTEMGRDLLAEDYILKQMMASLIYPEGKIGQEFWKRVYQEAIREYGTTSIAVSTFNKVWIVPEKAVVYENAQTGMAYILSAKLKVMLEEDYLSLSHHVIPVQSEIRHHLASQIIRQVIIPQIEKEINQGQNFAQLRQIYNSLILAIWYKRKIKNSILNQIYANQNKTRGTEYETNTIQQGKNKSSDVEGIYQRYLTAFKKGVYNYIKEDSDALTHQPISRRYFSGGVDWAQFGNQTNTVLYFTTDQARLHLPQNGSFDVTVDAVPIGIPSDHAMVADHAMEATPPNDLVAEEIAENLVNQLNNKVISAKNGDGYTVIAARHNSEINISLQKGQTIYYAQMIFTVTPDGSIEDLGINLIIKNQGLAKALFVLLSHALPYASKVMAFIMNRETRDEITQRCYIQGKKIFYRNGSAIRQVVTRINDSSKEILLEDVLASTLMGHLISNSQTSFDDLTIRYYRGSRQYEGLDAMLMLLRHKEFDLDGIERIPIFLLEVVKKNPGLLSDTDRDLAMNTQKGGIDFTAEKIPLEIQNARAGILFHWDAVMLKRLQNALGFSPEIISIKPLNDVRVFLTKGSISSTL